MNPTYWWATLAFVWLVKLLGSDDKPQTAVFLTIFTAAILGVRWFLRRKK